MGRGDKKTKRGKIFSASWGNSRKRVKKGTAFKKVVPAKKPAATKKPAAAKK